MLKTCYDRDHKSNLAHKTAYQGAKNSTIQSSLLLSTNSSKLWEFKSTEALGSDFSFDPLVAFPLNRSFRSAFTCKTMHLEHQHVMQVMQFLSSCITQLSVIDDPPSIETLHMINQTSILSYIKLQITIQSTVHATIQLA